MQEKKKNLQLLKVLLKKLVNRNWPDNSKKLFDSKKILLQQKEQHIVEQERRLQRLEEDQEQRQLLQPQPVRQTISTSTSVKKPSTLQGGTIDNLLSLKALKYMPKCVKKEPTEEEDDDVVITEVTQKTETVKYIPKAVPGIENLVLVPVPKSKTTAKRSSKVGPVPENLQDPKEVLLRQV